MEEPKRVGELKPVDLSGKLIPFKNGQPVFMSLGPLPDLYLPCFDNKEQLEGVMEEVSVTDYTIKQIDDGIEFIDSIPEEIKIALNFRRMPSGKTRWTEIKR